MTELFINKNYDIKMTKAHIAKLLKYKLNLKRKLKKS